MSDRIKMSFKDALESKFTVTAELSPPRGTNTDEVLEIAKKIKGKLDAVNVTDNQRAIMRMSSLAFSHILLEEGLEPIMQVCCRDKNRLYLQSEALGAFSLGIKNLCLMTGDHTKMGDHPGAKPVFDVDSTQLIKLIKDLEKGSSLSGKKLNGKPEFFLGGVVNPFSKPFELSLIKLKKKIDAGAGFFQTQPFFDVGSVFNFLEKTSSLNTKFIIGIVPLKSVRMIEFMNKNVLTTPIPDNIAKRLEASDDPICEGINISAGLINEIKAFADGVHIMPIGLEKHLPKLLDMI